jgi:hypothetical protein
MKSNRNVTHFPRLVSTLLAACTLFFWSPARASAEDFWMLFQNHRVTLIARDVTVSQILDQWARLGGTTVVNADAVQGGQVTLRLVDVPERYALDVLLRGVYGYIVAEREGELSDASTIGRILILRRTPGAAVTAASASSASIAAPIEPPGDGDVQTADASGVPGAASGVAGANVPRTPQRDPPGVATVSMVGGMQAVVPPSLPPGTFVGLGTISPGPGQAPQTVPMLFRQGTGATARPGETPAPEPITRLSSGPQPVPRQQE